MLNHLREKPTSLAALLLGVLIFAVLPDGFALAAAPAQVQAKQAELDQVRARRQKLEKDIKFEDHWEALLSKAQGKVKTAKAANSKAGKALAKLADLLTGGGSEAAIKTLIAEANSLLSPYFTVNRQGHLLWGSALRFSGMPGQFIPSGATALTPAAADEILTKWRANNQAKKTQNQSELATVKAKETRLAAELAALQSSLAAAGNAAAARAALKDCDLSRARGLINALPPGPEKNRLMQELAAADAQDRQSKALIDQARAKYRACRLAQTMKLLEQAAQKARCAADKQRVAGMIAKVTPHLELEKELRGMVNQAKALYKDCRLTKALDILNKALAKAKCQAHIDSLNKKIQIAQKRLNHEKTTVALRKEAKGLKGRGRYDDALDKLQSARQRTGCQRLRDLIDKDISAVQAADAKADKARDQAKCKEYQRQLRQLSSGAQKLIGKYVNDGINGLVSDATLQGYACGAVDRVRQFQSIAKQARSQGCQVKVRPPREGDVRTMVKVCGGGPQNRDGGQACRQYYNQMQQLGQVSMQITMRMQSLAGRKNVNKALVQNLACQLVANTKKMYRVMQQAKAAGCKVHNQMTPAHIAQFSRMCPGG
jgi:hypothetical protein